MKQEAKDIYIAPVINHTCSEGVVVGHPGGCPRVYVGGKVACPQGLTPQDQLHS